MGKTTIKDEEKKETSESIKLDCVAIVCCSSDGFILLIQHKIQNSRITVEEKPLASQELGKYILHILVKTKYIGHV